MIQALLHALKAECGGWRQVADALGGGYSGAFWRLIANGERHATVEQENIIRATRELPLLALSPAEEITRAGVDRVVHCSKRPNTALFVAVSGEVTNVRLKVSKTGDDVPATIPVTLSYSHAEKRRRHYGSCLPTMAEIAALSADSFKTAYGKTGNLSAIAAAAERAADEFRIDLC